jgi:hypothetical protein
MSDSEDSDTEFPFDRIEPELPVCVGVDPVFCKLAFLIKQTLYDDIMYQGEPDTKQAQSTDLNDSYEAKIGALHILFMDLFRRRQPQNTGVPQEVEQKLPANVKDKVAELYNSCYEQANNADRQQMESYKRLIDNIFRTYIYDMGTRR